MDSPAFGQADLTNCERELIHLAGSVQPHGVMLLLAEPGLQVLQVSENADTVLGAPAGALLDRQLEGLGGDLAAQVRGLLAELADEPLPLLCHIETGRGPRRLEGMVHRSAQGGVIVELECIDPPTAGPQALNLDPAVLREGIAQAVRRFTAAASLPALSDAIVQVVRELTGYDRVMVYRFDTDGHGEIVAEARNPRLESLLGHHYPASDIPQRARELYLRNRVRVLIDVDYTPQALVPLLRPDDGQPLDMSMCQLRSMSPLHLQYLRNMGVTGTLVASLVHEGKLWGLIAAHHYSPRRLRLPMRAAIDLLAEVASTRIAAIANYAHAQVALMVRRLEQRLIEATSTEGDWRQALFRSPRTLLQPLEATGAALFHEGEIMTTGEVPSTPELRALCAWVDAQPGEKTPFACGSVGKLHAPLASLTPTASGVLAVKLSLARPDYLMWFRKEQLLTVNWAGDPYKPMEGTDPLQLSPRRSFETWSEIVRGTALPWSPAELTMARAIGMALVDIIVQVHAVRLLIAEHQLAQIRETLTTSHEPVLLADAQGRLMFSNEAFAALRGSTLGAPILGSPLAALFCDRLAAERALASHAQAWRGEWAVDNGSAQGLPVAVRLEAVPGRDQRLLGHVLTLTDLRAMRRTAEARRHLEASLLMAGAGTRQPDEVLGAILTNASLAAMDVADAAGAPTVAPLIEALEASARRATTLYAQIRSFAGPESP